MSEKYIDLAEQIRNSLYTGGLRPVQIHEVLNWLDEHPDQVPRRTITRHDFERAFDFHFDDEDIDRHERFLAHLGITVVPGPEPTNAEKLERLMLDLELVADATERRIMAKALSGEGVRAPEANDE